MSIVSCLLRVPLPKVHLFNASDRTHTCTRTQTIDEQPDWARRDNVGLYWQSQRLLIDDAVHHPSPRIFDRTRPL
jgi:hypothetical protein